MTFDAQASAMSHAEIVELLKVHAALQQSHEELARQVAWFKRQLFGATSERRIVDELGRQLTLGEVERAERAAAPGIEVAGHRCRRAAGSDAEAQAPRFDDTVPVEEIVVGNREIEHPEAWAVVGEKVTCRLAQRPGSYVMLRYVRKVYKRKTDGAFSCAPAPAAVLERSCADVSFLAGQLIDRFLYHLPLYRQHQRLAAAGVHLGRSTLTHLVHRSAELLQPVYAAQLRSILASAVLAMDETPIKAGRKKRPPPQRGAMRTAYFWPLYGDRDEIAFPFATTRGSAVVREALKDFGGVLLSDGYQVYERYVAAVQGIVHAQCWAHARRHFEEAASAEPVRCGQALEMIAELYQCEKRMREKALPPEGALAYRAEHARPVVARFFEWIQTTLNTQILLPSNPFTQAAKYAFARQKELQVFLEYPGVQLDTNHLERTIRPIAIGRKNWLFCWTEIGAEYVGVIQSLLSTCRVQGIDPYTYLVDVLQRIDRHPAKDVALLTPRLWKEHFAQTPLRSDLDRTPPACQE